jgi:muconolactone delta-isomerase
MSMPDNKDTDRFDEQVRALRLAERLSQEVQAQGVPEHLWPQVLKYLAAIMGLEIEVTDRESGSGRSAE